MKVILQILSTAGLSYFVQQFFPWWSVPISAAIVAMLISNSKLSAFWGGFAGISLLWMIQATLIDMQTESILSQKILPLFHLTSMSSLIIATGLIGGFIGGMGALTGHILKKLVAQN